MSFIERFGTREYFCEWKIENLRHSFPYSNLNSPVFAKDLLHNTTWTMRIKIFPFTISLVGEVGEGECKLQNYSSHYDVLMLASDGSFKELSPTKQLYRPTLINNTVILEIILTEDFNIFLSKYDTLTLCCHLWIEDVKDIQSVHSFFYTRIKTDVVSFTWAIKDFSSVDKQRRIVSRATSLVIIFLSSSDDTYSTDKIQIKIYLSEPRKLGQNINCKISLLDGDENVVITDSLELEIHSFCPDYYVKTFQLFNINKNFLLENRNLYLLNNTLSLCFDVEVTNGDTIEETECVTLGEPPRQSLVNKDGQSFINGRQETSPATDSLTDKVLHQGYYVTLKTKTSLFRVNEDVLRAKSSVLDQLLKENTTKIIKLLDLTDETVRQMVLFLNEDTVEDLRWENAVNLYFASAKYQIHLLKRMCTLFLKDVDFSNAADVLQLVDSHQDSELKSALLAVLMDEEKFKSARRMQNHCPRIIEKNLQNH